jgi:hypothetical protein
MIMNLQAHGMSNMLTQEEFDAQMLSWCRQREDLCLLDIGTYAWIISDEGISMGDNYIANFVNKYLTLKE